MAGSRKRGARNSWLEVLKVSLKLGLTSFGGPAAHLGYFHGEYVRKRQWMDERSYADLVALCQFLPGPASSQVGIGIGTVRAGLVGGIAAWIGFTMPSVVALALFAMLLQSFDLAGEGWIHGLKIVAVAIVAHAIAGMGQKLTPDRSRISIAVAASVVTLLVPNAAGQIIVLLLAAVCGWIWFRRQAEADVPVLDVPVSRRTAIVCLVLFFGLLAALPLLRGWISSHWLAVFDSYYRSGSLVFGGGHVVLPFLEKETVAAGWVSKEAFLAGYGATQAVPGPLFTFASYLGAIDGGWIGAAVATFAIFLPAYLLVTGTLPFWNVIRTSPALQGVLAGVNAAVVGLLLAALYDPLWTSAIGSTADFAWAAVLYTMLAYWKVPPWIVVVTGALGGMGLAVLL
ncbi:chromate transporter [Paenibacillus oceani]|uniref:Chromate transporter n=1 Tax=Paenibacillus oceani TaxID=2772510 RepID=A0A927CA90_9BACL|nr:chromate transporter [Paenibacillus oceani]MBD2863007.1 chromate transporter [Paenibacillus oceani]